MLILDGKIASAAVKATLLAQTQALTTEGKRAPHLAAILVGNNGASETYVASKVKNCEETGFESTLIRLDVAVSEKILLDKIIELNVYKSKQLYPEPLRLVEFYDSENDVILTALFVDISCFALAFGS